MWFIRMVWVYCVGIVVMVVVLVVFVMSGVYVVGVREMSKLQVYLVFGFFYLCGGFVIFDWYYGEISCYYQFDGILQFMN